MPGPILNDTNNFDNNATGKQNKLHNLSSNYMNSETSTTLSGNNLNNESLATGDNYETGNTSSLYNKPLATGDNFIPGNTSSSNIESLSGRPMDSSMSNTGAGFTGAGMQDATLLDSEATTFNPDPSLRNNNYNTMTEYERLQGLGSGLNTTSGMGNTTSGMGNDLTSSSMQPANTYDNTSSFGARDSSMNQYDTDSTVVGSGAAGSTTGAGLGSTSTGTYANDATSNYSRDTMDSNTNASTNAKGQHSTLHGTTEKLTGSVQAVLGKAIKKPAMVEAGQEKKIAGQEEVALAKEEKAMKKNH